MASIYGTMACYSHSKLAYGTKIAIYRMITNGTIWPYVNAIFMPFYVVFKEMLLEYVAMLYGIFTHIYQRMGHISYLVW
jgi:hypothetical protein